jgi:subtilase family serine protease
MQPHFISRILWCTLAVCGTLATGRPAAAETAPLLVTHSINEHETVSLPGNTRPEARPGNDLGPLSAGFPLEHLQILLNRPAAIQAALDAYVAGLTNPASPDFHQWLTSATLSDRFGPNPQDVQIVTGWLQDHGFHINSVQNGRTVIDFSGTAGQVDATFSTSIHALTVRGAPHIANMSNPRIPAALAGIINGVISLNDFRPHPYFKLRSAYTFSSGGQTTQAVVPADLATIYNFNPLFAAGISGQGQTIVVIEDTNVYATTNWATFRATFGLSGYTKGSFTQVHPGSCTNPGTVASNEVEATLDAEWASAAAPSAAIELASCADTSTTFGGLIALENLLDSSEPPSIVSISYGECETENGATANAAYNTIYEEAAAQGVSVFVSAGDEGAASCDADETTATHGIGVSGFASTPYNVAVGGTDFGDTYAGTNSTYWSSSNGTTYGSALSYIPEIPWNDSCASVLIATVQGYSTTYGSSGFCNSRPGEQDFLTTASGSGGPSGCATGSPTISGVVSGSCKGYAKPTWQSLVGNPADGVRDLPDVSLFAANGVWSHYYIFCDSDTRDDVTCSGAPSNWSGAGGTSFASPIIAGIQALVNQKQAAKQGNPAPVYYAIAELEYGKKGDASCNSTSGNAAASSCIFYDVTLGDNDVNCTGSHNCYLPSGRNGVLSTSSSTYAKAYPTGTGWDFATGIGTVNAINLVDGWAAGAAAAKK